MNFQSMLKSLEIHDRAINQDALDFPLKSLVREFVLPENLRRLAAANLEAKDLRPIFGEIPNELISSQMPVKKADTFEISLHSPLFKKYFHRHNYIELDYVYKGSCSYFIDTEDNSFLLQQNELCIINQNVAHAIELTDSNDILLKCFIPFHLINTGLFNALGRESAVSSFISNSLLQDTTYYSFIVFRPSETDIIQDILARLIAEYIDQPLGWEQATGNYLSLLFLELVRREETGSITRKASFQDRIVDSMIARIRDDFKTITLQELARDYHFHENYLSRMIRRSSGLSFSDLLTQVRLAETEKLLRSTSLTVAEIAARLGYVGAAYLFRLFKSKYGMTPQQYRSQCTHAATGSHH